MMRPRETVVHRAACAALKLPKTRVGVQSIRHGFAAVYVYAPLGAVLTEQIGTLAAVLTDLCPKGWAVWQCWTEAGVNVGEPAIWSVNIVP